MLSKINPIEVFPWNRNFETGIPLVDEQHKKLVELLNRLAIAIAYDTGDLAMNQVFDELAEYAKYHFDAEEAIWKPAFFADEWFTGHQGSHESFIAKVAEFRQKIASSADGDLHHQVLRFLIHWLAYHILDNDMRMAKALHGMEQGLDLPRAKLRANEEMSGSVQVFIETLLSMYEDLSSRTLDLVGERVKRSKVEEALKASQQEERAFSDAVISAIPGLVYVYDDQLRLKRWNKGYEVLGYSDTELKGKNILEFFLESRRPEIIQGLEALKRGQPAGVEAYALKKDGSEAPYFFSAVPVELDGKNCFLGVGIDISQLKQIEAALIESRSSHEEAQRLAHLGHWKLNHLTAEVFWSDEASRIFELDPRKFKPSFATILACIHPDDQSLIETSFRNVTPDNPSFELTFRLAFANGRMKSVRMSAIVAFDSQGQPLESVGTVHDITANVLAEQELEKKVHRVKKCPDRHRHGGEPGDGSARPLYQWTPTAGCENRSCDCPETRSGGAPNRRIAPGRYRA